MAKTIRKTRAASPEQTTKSQDRTKDTTPMMRQYQEIKQQHQDSVLLFRMGDFYEMFHNDAEEVSRLLNLTLTRRQGVPMAGIPYHALQNYLRRLLQAGKRLAICEQIEQAQVSRGLTKREVVEVISPGTVLQDDFLERSSNNYLQAFCKQGQYLGMALLDFSTGEFHAAGFTAPGKELRAEILQRELLLAASRELLVMEELNDEFDEDFWSQAGGTDVNMGEGGLAGRGAARSALLCNRIPAWCFAPESAKRKLCEFFGVHSLKGFGFGEETRLDMADGAALGAAWVLIEYLQQSQKQASALAHIQRLLPLRRSELLQLDSAALRNLEVFQNMQNGTRDYTLCQLLQQSRSAMGSRCLHRWLREPLLQSDLLNMRYERVEALVNDGLLRESLRESLARLSDLERIMSRVASAKANARDLVALRQSLDLYRDMESKLGGSGQRHRFCGLFEPLEQRAGQMAPRQGWAQQDSPQNAEHQSSSQATRGSVREPAGAEENAEWQQNGQEEQKEQDGLGIPIAVEKRSDGRVGGKALAILQELWQLLQRALTENPPIVLHSGGMIAPGYSAELDELQALLSDRRSILDDYVAREQALVGSVKLKLKYNKLIGYYFEITKTQAASARLPEHFLRRQVLSTGERYSTEELAALENKLHSADEQIVRLERQLFEQLCRELEPYLELVLSLGRSLAELDVLSGFAELALRHNYVRPELLEPGAALCIEEGRHPVVEHHLRGEDFVPNSLELDQEHFFALITGPNMAGKSTYLRQNAQIVLLAQIGCFVPARRARIPLVDRIFCRVGASDNLSRGESTFMVEMQETARILNEASRHSLVIMDEVGRGTSTRDGLAIAQSICEHLLHQIQCMTLFATHYHELTGLCERHLKLLCLAVDEGEDGNIRFLKHVEEGSIASSYGIHVAALAGIPGEVTARAQEILSCFEQQSLVSPATWPAMETVETLPTPDIQPGKRGRRQNPGTSALPQNLQNQREYPYCQVAETKLAELAEAKSVDPDRIPHPPHSQDSGGTSPNSAGKGDKRYHKSRKIAAEGNMRSEQTGTIQKESGSSEELPTPSRETFGNKEESGKSREKSRGKKQQFLFSEAELLLGDLEALANSRLEQLKPTAALKILRQWAQKYLGP